MFDQLRRPPRRRVRNLTLGMELRRGHQARNTVAGRSVLPSCALDDRMIQLYSPGRHGYIHTSLHTCGWGEWLFLGLILWRLGRSCPCSPSRRVQCKFTKAGFGCPQPLAEGSHPRRSPERVLVNSWNSQTSRFRGLRVAGLPRPKRVWPLLLCRLADASASGRRQHHLRRGCFGGGWPTFLHWGCRTPFHRPRLGTHLNTHGVRADQGVRGNVLLLRAARSPFRRRICTTGCGTVRPLTACPSSCS